MIQLEQTYTHAKATNKVSLETEQEKDTAEKSMEELKRQMQPKRARTHDNAGEILAEVDNNWDLIVHRRETTRVKNVVMCKSGLSRINRILTQVRTGIWDRDKRVAEIVVRELEKTKPDKWGCVQSRAVVRRSSGWSSTSTRSIEGYVSTTVTVPWWLAYDCIE